MRGRDAHLLLLPSLALLLLFAQPLLLLFAFPIFLCSSFALLLFLPHHAKFLASNHATYHSL
jgi:hypothetical protein